MAVVEMAADSDLAELARELLSAAERTAREEDEEL
jgi:hypothetical protein